MRKPTAINPVDMSHIKGQEHVKHALEVAASGGHNCLMSGSFRAMVQGQLSSCNRRHFARPRMGCATQIDMFKCRSSEAKVPVELAL